MNMKDDYLWDKTGEPDPEVQQLEEILGTLRYQPRPLPIPAGLRGEHERNFFRGAAPRLAIAATIAMLLFGLGVWLVKQRSERSQPTEVAKTADKPAPVKLTSTEAPTSNQDSNPNAGAAVATATGAEARPSGRAQTSGSQLAANRARREARDARQLAELREAEAAKDQLMIALRVVSAKLTYAQKKTQGTNQIHNQHKIG